MAIADLLQRHLLAAAAVTGLLVGGIVGLFFPIKAASPPESRAETWSLPALADTKRFRADAYSGLRNARFWGPVLAPGQRSAPTVEWTLVAIVTRPRLMAAISAKGPQASKLIAVGGQLPDGSTLVHLSRDAIWFEKDGCRRERRLYRAVTAENNACLGEARPEAGSSATPPAVTPSSATGADPARPTPPLARSTTP